MRTNSIFHNLVTDENSFTELVCNLFRYKAFRGVFSDLLNRALHLNEPTFAFRQVESQRGGTGGRPDVRIESERSCIVLECKVRNSSLTAAQRRGYSTVLRRSIAPTRALVFLLPEGFHQSQEVDALVKRARNGVRVGRIDWGDVIDEVESRGLHETNEVFQEFVTLLRLWSVLKTITFDKEGLEMLYRSDVGGAYWNLLTLVETVGKQMANFPHLKWIINEDGYGFYLKDKRGAEVVWFGVDYDYWQRTGFPLSVGTSAPRKLPKSKLVRDLVKAKYEDSNWDYLGIPQNMVAQEKNSPAFVHMLTSLYEQLAKARR